MSAYLHRAIGLETEYGITERGQAFDPIILSADIVRAYADTVPHARWDYGGEDPLADQRGYRLPRQLADASMLTDNPAEMAPSGPSANITRSEASQQVGGAANAVLGNGGRLYVDHAHPEFSTPEVIGALAAVRYDRAGDAIMRIAADNLAARGRNVAIYKNNVDGKGASYGSHENYLISRDLPFGDVVQHLTTLFVARQLFTGTGRVGIGQRSEEAGFQISQRADYIETDVGLQTTFERPIINTRDEPHADARHYRRLHVIVGDATSFDVATYLKVGVTSLVLWLLERGELPLQLDALSLTAPVVDTWAVSREPFTHRLSTQTGSYSALDILCVFRDLIGEALTADGIDDAEVWQVVDTFTRILEGLATDPDGLGADIEWIGKKQLLQSLARRRNLSWDAPAIRAADLQWHELSERSLLAMVERAGRVRRLVSAHEVDTAISQPPADTRASLRGGLIGAFSERVGAASWSKLVCEDPHGEGEVHISLPTPYGGVSPQLFTTGDYGDVLDALE